MNVGLISQTDGDASRVLGLRELGVPSLKWRRDSHAAGWTPQKMSGPSRWPGLLFRMHSHGSGGAGEIVVNARAQAVDAHHDPSCDLYMRGFSPAGDGLVGGWCNGDWKLICAMEKESASVTGVGKKHKV